MGVSRPRAPLGARCMHLHLSLDTCICRWIHAWVPRVEAGMYYEVRSWRKHPMLSCLTSDQRADQGGAMSLGPGAGKNKWVGKQPIKRPPPDQTMSRGVQMLNESDVSA
jgi:hypothetical protein